MLKQIEARIEASKYDIVVLTGKIPKEVLVGMDHWSCLADKEIRIRYTKTYASWIASTFEYESRIGGFSNVLIVDYHKFMGRDKSELRKTIRNSRW